MTNSSGKRVTLATIKSFINRELGNNNLYIKRLSDFDGMVDCVMPKNGEEFTKAEKLGHDKESKYNNGVGGAWFVGQSRDYFRAYVDEKYVGYEVYNCCGSFILAMAR